MKSGRVSIYYNPEWGYIIAFDTTLKDSVMWVTINPVDTKKPDVAEQELGEAVLAGLEKSRAASPVTREEIEDFKFWQVTGIRGFAAFSKRFKCVEVTEKGSILKLERLKRDSDGAYSWIKNDRGIELPISSTEKHIGQLICHMLQPDDSNDQSDGNRACFLSINKNKFIYSLPSDEFVDIGDGHTDAYQIYTNKNDEKSYIAFLIDNGYSKISRKGIKKRWKQIYGRIKEYHFEIKEEGLLKAVAVAKAEQSNIYSYFYQDGEDLLEVLTEVSTNIPKNQQVEIEKEIKRVVDSVSISED